MDTLIQAAANGSWTAPITLIAIIAGVAFFYWLLFSKD